MAAIPVTSESHPTVTDTPVRMRAVLQGRAAEAAEAAVIAAEAAPMPQQTAAEAEAEAPAAACSMTAA